MPGVAGALLQAVAHVSGSLYPEGPTSVRWVTDPEETLTMEEHECFVHGGPACRHVRRVDQRCAVETSVCDA